MNKKLQDCWSLEQELQMRIDWLEKGLNEIYQDLVGKPMKARDHKDAQRLLAMVQSISDGEPTTADEFNEAQIQEGEELIKEYGDHEG